jgi:hypothetical protein
MTRTTTSPSSTDSRSPVARAAASARDQPTASPGQPRCARAAGAASLPRRPGNDGFTLPARLTSMAGAACCCRSWAKDRLPQRDAGARACRCSPAQSDSSFAAADDTDLFQSAELVGDGSRARQPHTAADVPHRGRFSVLGHPVPDARQDPLLLIRQEVFRHLQLPDPLPEFDPGRRRPAGTRLPDRDGRPADIQPLQPRCRAAASTGTPRRRSSAA